MLLGSPLTELLLLAGGAALLYAGAELLVKGASDLALAVGLKASTVGVTVVAFATTAPELFVSLLGAVTVSTDTGLGAIVGSNIANIGLVLGVSALIRPLNISQTVFERHIPFMVLAALLLVGLGWDGQIGAVDGVLLLAVLVAFTAVVLRRVQQTQSGISAAERAEMPEARVRDAAAVVGGIVALVVGSSWLVDGGQSLLSAAGFSDIFIGLTVLALGTSLPELAASVIAAIRGEAEFSVGNVVGSNIYNILAVIGIVAVVTPISVAPSVRGFEFPALLAFTALLVGLMYRGDRISRVDGSVLVVGYVLFVYLLLP
ncbi:calcium/sodium antiporter [Halorubrum lacusprofundi]|uniref:Na+/Ca+ antiporter, CaCA family n=1 Tax=Halorubrum lacusprofundi (strain ATCC 49239 / DSM 5036 / JCM 8891 / ACAM 34) TaxID=416348 RepID=B9LV24_HALLT|nr:calcium/sodium antiporter [Halorubrum lacusprofundi]ACM56501.1 Na+/Ca+ antiporter, CaCA family [Halorubrum lacusprofundi ATCC 49239]MCG1005227.1 calcium/sodium antiporter [Halorubrum lacusprofundi]